MFVWQILRQNYFFNLPKSKIFELGLLLSGLVPRESTLRSSTWTKKIGKRMARMRLTKSVINFKNVIKTIKTFVKIHHFDQNSVKFLFSSANHIDKNILTRLKLLRMARWPWAASLSIKLWSRKRICWKYFSTWKFRFNTLAKFTCSRLAFFQDTIQFINLTI